MSLICKDVGVSFVGVGSGVCALHGLSFQCRAGEFLTIIGPSGCGKTTLLRVLAGLIPPTFGTMQSEELGLGERGGKSIVFQEGGLFPWLTVIENAAFALEAQGVARREREERARELLDRFGVTGRDRAYPHEISAGMRQRVAVVRSFLSEPAFLLMDEPFGALDAQTRYRLQQELLTVWEQRRTGVVFVTHDVEEAILLSDRILLMSAQPGRIANEYKVRLPRPRTAEVTVTGEFMALKAKLLADLELISAYAEPHQPAMSSGRWELD